MSGLFGKDGGSNDSGGSDQCDHELPREVLVVEDAGDGMDARQRRRQRQSSTTAASSS